MADPSERRRRIDTIRTLGTLSTVGFSFVLAVGLGALAGYGLDRLFNNDRYPVFFLLFAMFGLVAGIINVFRASSKLK